MFKVDIRDKYKMLYLKNRFSMRNKFIYFLLVILIFPGINIDIAKANGTLWTVRSAPGDGNTPFESVTYGNGLFVAVGQSVSTPKISPVMSSPDGIDWTSGTGADYNEWTGVAYGGATFVAVSWNGTNRVMTSTNGKAWTPVTSPTAASGTWSSVTYGTVGGNGLFVAVSNNGKVMTSPDGATWTERNVGVVTNEWTNITYGTVNNVGLFVAVGYASLGKPAVRVMTSPDGINWTSRTSGVEARTWMSVTYGTVGGNGLFVAAGYEARNGYVMTSPDGATWTERSTTLNKEWLTVGYGNGLFVVPESNIVLTSSDGTTWPESITTGNAPWKDVTYSNGLFVAVSNTGIRVMTSGTFLSAPAFTLSSSSETRTVNTAATGFTINSTGGAIASFAINATPAGMSFNTTTGALSGTPNTVSGASAYTITATNTSGTAQRTFTLTVGIAAPAFTLSSSSESKTVNTAITGYTISSTGGTIASYAISPAAPAGLTFNTTTGLLTGTPTEIAAATAYTITATNATSSTTQTFTLIVTAVPVAPNNADNSAAQAEAARRANEQRQMGDLSSVLPLINELIKEIEDGLKSTSAPKKKSSTSKTKQSSQAKPEKKSNSEPLTIPIPPATEPEAQKQVGELVSVSHKVGFGLSASWINSSNIKALRGFIAGIEESFEVERIVIQGYAQPTKIGLSDIDIARAKAVKKLLIKDGLDYPIVVEGMGQAESKKGDLSRLAVVTVEGKSKKPIN